MWSVYSKLILKITAEYDDGTYKIISEDRFATKIECNLSDCKGSNTIYLLTINEIDRNGVCAEKNEPKFSIEKT